MLTNPKLFSLEEATKIRNQPHDCAVVLTNGCFDLLHAGHVFSLQQAAKFGELWVALNDDASICQLKGPSRPIIGENERAYILSALECVRGIFIFTGQRLTQELKTFRPDIYVKSADYNFETLHREEHLILTKMRTTIEFVQTLPGLSTTILINKIQNLAH
jgi:D-beta-D-heptose 7-phosphate kinase/D-beta-D-heptose 1-phosphate adenosyltransferase